MKTFRILYTTDRGPDVPHVAFVEANNGVDARILFKREMETKKRIPNSSVHIINITEDAKPCVEGRVISLG